MNPGILEPFSYLWHVFLSRMGTGGRVWQWFDPLVAEGSLSLLGRGPFSIPHSFQNIVPVVLSTLLQGDTLMNLPNFS